MKNLEVLEVVRQGKVLDKPRGCLNGVYNVSLLKNKYLYLLVIQPCKRQTLVRRQFSVAYFHRERFFALRKILNDTKNVECDR